VEVQTRAAFSSAVDRKPACRAFAPTRSSQRVARSAHWRAAGGAGETVPLSQPGGPILLEGCLGPVQPEHGPLGALPRVGATAGACADRAARPRPADAPGRSLALASDEIGFCGDGRFPASASRRRRGGSGGPASEVAPRLGVDGLARSLRANVSIFPAPALPIAALPRRYPPSGHGDKTWLAVPPPRILVGCRGPPPHFGRRV